jgi:hypothetical protein
MALVQLDPSIDEFIAVQMHNQHTLLGLARPQNPHGHLIRPSVLTPR